MARDHARHPAAAQQLHGPGARARAAWGGLRSWNENRRHGASFNAQALANTAWAYSRTGRASPPLLHALASEATPRLSEFKPQELASLAWSFTACCRSASAASWCSDRHLPSMAALFRALSEAAPPRLGEFAPQGLANLAWAFAAGGQPAPALFDALAAEATPRLAEFKPQELASLAWSFATAGHAAPEPLSNRATATRL